MFNVMIYDYLKSVIFPVVTYIKRIKYTGRQLFKVLKHIKCIKWKMIHC